MPESDNLQRFIDAQTATYAAVERELAAGHKQSHWMWFIFPQLDGLGSSEMARRFALKSLDEAQAYLAHPLLGVRLRDCVGLLQGLPRANADTVFGTVDAMKLRSSLTLFVKAGGGPLFQAALDRWFSGRADERTQRLLERLLRGGGQADEAPARPIWRTGEGCLRKSSTVFSQADVHESFS